MLYFFRGPRTVAHVRASGSAMFPYDSRNWFALLGSLAVSAAHPACNTNAVGIEDCRHIEYARCDAALHCPNQFGIDDPAECKRFYRDHCLHGMPTAANANDVRSCVRAIEQLGTCAKDNGQKTAAAVCNASYVNTNQTVCALIAEPEALLACSFLGGAESSSGQAGGASSQPKTTAAQTGGSPTAEAAAGGAPGLESLVTGAGGVMDLLGLGGLPF
jgi:hypothetical protein